MSLVYVIHWLAKEVNGDFVSSMIEFVTADRIRAEQMFAEGIANEEVILVDGHMCVVHRQIVQAELDQQYKV